MAASRARIGSGQQPGAGNQIRLVDLDEEDRQLLMAEAREQVKREYGLPDPGPPLLLQAN
jgi:hypothetical protein